MRKEKEQIKRLIKSGFELELISFELDIPIEQLEKYKKELEKNKKTENVIDKENEYAHSKMEQMRKNYNSLYNNGNRVEISSFKELSQEEKDLIDTTILKIETMLEEEKGSSIDKKCVAKILLEINDVTQHQITIEQAEKLLLLLQDEKIKELSVKPRDDINSKFVYTKKLIFKKLAEAVNIKHYMVDDLEELEKLNEKITPEMTRENPLIIASIKSKISQKIIKIRQREKQDRSIENIPADIIEIIKDLVGGELNIDTANEIIDREAKSQVEKNPKTRFSMTEEQRKQQILIQIRMALTDYADKFVIENPEIVIEQMGNLFKGEQQQINVSTVVNNFCARGEFEKAKIICDQYLEGNRDINSYKYYKRLKKEVGNQEIGNLVLKGLNDFTTIEEEKSFLKLIEKRVENGDIKLDAISLGKSKDGLKNITLSDIYFEENKKQSQR